MLGCDLWAGITMVAYLVCPISNFKMCVVHYFLNNRTARSSDAIVLALWPV